MNKRGQIYILAAVLLCVAIYGVITEVNTASRRVLIDDFEEFSKNYDYEADNILTYTLLKGEDATTRLNRLIEVSDDFAEFIKSSEPNMGFVYVYSEGGQFKVINYLNEKITVLSQESGEIQVGGQSQSSIQQLDISIGEQNYVEGIDTDLGEFGSQFYQTDVGGEEVTIGIGGAVHSFETSDNPTSFSIIVKEDGQIVKVLETESNPR